MSTLNRSQSQGGWARDVIRDVRMVFDLFIESLQSGTPNQLYSVTYERGDKFKESTGPIRADESGNIEIQIRRSFVATLQRRSSVAYKKKIFRLSVSEQPSGLIVSEIEYDLAAYVEHEVFPHKKLVVRSPNSNVRLSLALSGISEEDFIRLNSDVVRAASMTGPTVDHTDDRENSGSLPVSEARAQRNASTAKQPSSTSQRAVSSMNTNHHVSSGSAGNSQQRGDVQEAEDDDLGDLVNEAVAIVSGRKLEEPPHQASKPPLRQQPSASPDPMPAVEPPAAPIEEQDVAVTVQEPQPEVVVFREPAPKQVQRDAAAALPPPTRVATVSPSPEAVGPLTRGASQPVLVTPPQSQAPSQNRREKSSYVDPRGVSSSLAIGGTSVVQSASQPAIPPSPASVSIGSTEHFVEKAAPQVTSKVEKDVERYLQEIVASVALMSEELLLSNGGPGDAAGKHRSNSRAAQRQTNANNGFAFLPGAKTSSTIPRATLLALHCLQYWSGAKRAQFLHDFLAMLFVEVVPNTRHPAMWMNVLLHLLYHALSDAEFNDEAASAYAPLSDDEAIQVADAVITCIQNTETSGYGSRNTFMIRGSKSDSLWQALQSAEPLGSSESEVVGRLSSVQSMNPLPLPPLSSIAFSIALDEALRRLSDAAAGELLDDVQRFCHPTPRRPTPHTVDGFRYKVTGPSPSYGLGGGGSDHPTDDPALSVVLNTLDKLYRKLHGTTADRVLSAASPLLRLANAELMKIVFTNICNTYINNVVTEEKVGDETRLITRLRTVRDGMNFKLALSMLESWLQEHHLFTAAREVLLPCRQLCDLLILQKKLLQNADVSEEVTSHLHPNLVVCVLEQFRSSADDMGDYVPEAVLQSFRRIAEEKARSQKRPTAALRGASVESTQHQISMPPKLPVRQLSSFGFVDYVTSLLPRADELGQQGENTRKSVRESISAAARAAQLEDHHAGGAGTSSASVATLERSLNWDRPPSEIATIRNREAIVGLTTHDVEGKRLVGTSQQLAQDMFTLRLSGLSVVDQDTIRRMVV